MERMALNQTLSEDQPAMVKQLPILMVQRDNNLKTLTGSVWIQTSLRGLLLNSIKRRKKRLLMRWVLDKARERSDLTLKVKRKLKIESARHKNCTGRDLLQFWAIKSCQCGRPLTNRWRSITRCWSTERTWLNRQDCWTSRTKSWRPYWTSTCRLEWTKSCRYHQRKWSDLIFDVCSLSLKFKWN